MCKLCKDFLSRKITLTTQGLVDIPYTKKEYEIKKDEKEIGGIRILGVNNVKEHSVLKVAKGDQKPMYKLKLNH